MHMQLYDDDGDSGESPHQTPSTTSTRLQRPRTPAVTAYVQVTLRAVTDLASTAGLTLAVALSARFQSHFALTYIAVRVFLVQPNKSSSTPLLSFPKSTCVFVR